MLEALGLSAGRIWIELQSPSCSPGDTVRGRLRLELKSERVDAKRLAVGLRAEQSAQGVGLQGVTFAFDRMYDEAKTLGGARSYKNGEWADFELTVPTSIREARLEHRSRRGEYDATELLAKVTPPSVSDITCEVLVLLERDWASDVKGHTPLVVVPLAKPR